MGKFYEKIVQPLLFGIPAEAAHEMAIETLRLGLGSAAAREAAAKRLLTAPFGKIRKFGLDFANPIGVAAGFDKNGVVVDQLAALGFGFVEVGTVTAEPQPGNEKPRLFRLPADKALINRLGFNNDGAAVVAERLMKIDRRCVVGINIGKNKAVPVQEAAQNYLKCFEAVHAAADYVTTNVSSPNTPNLRELQKAEHLEELLGVLQKRNFERGAKPLLLKIAPDVGEADIEAIVDVAAKFKIDGIVATNTTTGRSGLVSPALEIDKIGSGGLSGRPLAERANEVISAIYRKSSGQLPIIGVGGIFTGEDAFRKVAAGASLLQVYTGFVYGGPRFAREIDLGLAAALEKNGFAKLSDAVGSAVRPRP